MQVDYVWNNIARLDGVSPGDRPPCSTRSRSTATSPATPTSPSAPPSSSTCASRRTSTTPTSRSRCACSGGAGTSRWRAGCATTSTSRSAAAASGAWRHAFNLLVTFLLVGLWHGASLDVRRLGRPARLLPRRREPRFARAGHARARRQLGAGRRRARRRRRLRARDVRLGVLPGAVARRRDRVPRAGVHAPLGAGDFARFVPTLLLSAALLVYEWFTRGWEHGLSIAAAPLAGALGRLRRPLHGAAPLRLPRREAGDLCPVLGAPGGPFAFLVRVALFALVFGGVAEVWFRTVMPASETADQLPAAAGDHVPVRPVTARPQASSPSAACAVRGGDVAGQQRRVEQRRGLRRPSPSGKRPTGRAVRRLLHRGVSHRRGRAHRRLSPEDAARHRLLRLRRVGLVPGAVRGREPLRRASAFSPTCWSSS